MIEIRGAAEGPLDGVDLELPLGKLICFLGPSGSGARTMAGALFQESRRRYAMALSSFERDRLGRLAEVAIDDVRGLPPAALISQDLNASASMGSILHLTQLLDELFLLAGVVRCSNCDAGTCLSFDPSQAAEMVVERFSGHRCLFAAPLTLNPEIQIDALVAEVRRAGFSRVWFKESLRHLEELQSDPSLLDGSAELVVVVDRVGCEPEHTSRIAEAVRTAQLMGRGQGRVISPDSGQTAWVSRQLTCETCGARKGDREELEATVDGSIIKDVEALSVAQASRFCERAVSAVVKCRSSDDASAILESLQKGLSRAVALDLGHVPLDRECGSMSAGERLRLAIASAAGQGLVGLLYIVQTPISILDETARVRALAALGDLVQSGNTVILLDNDREVMSACDETVRFRHGRLQVMADTRVPQWVEACVGNQVENAPRCEIRGIGVPNLGSVDISFPVGAFTAVVGQSGSGKSVLLRDVIIPALKSAWGRARPREGGNRQVQCLNSAGLKRHTFVDDSRDGREEVVLSALGLFGRFAALYARTPAALERGYERSFFELQRPGGRCATCEGAGRISYDMEFFADLSLACTSCQGRRFREAVLEVTVKGYSIADLLEINLEGARRHFRQEKAIDQCLDAAMECGLGSLVLGALTADLDPAHILRLKLAVALARAGAREIVIVDTPVAGLHADDLNIVLGVLREFVRRGATVVVADSFRNMSLCADWIIELGPIGGVDGGGVSYCGATECFARGRHS